MTRNRNKILYSLVQREEGTFLNLSVDSKRTEVLKDFYLEMEKISEKDLDGELIHGSSFSTLKILLKEGIKKYEDLLYLFVDPIKNKI